MYLDFQVKIPTESADITCKKIKGTTYIYYAYEHNYNTEKGYTVPKNTTIGKCTDDGSGLMYPNTNFLKFFPAEELPETKGSVYRSGCLRAGTYFVLRKIIAEYRLDGWNEKQDHRQKIYISYDSTNKNCQAGDIDFVEYGYPKEDKGHLL